MATQTMNREQLVQLIRETCGPQVSEVVQAAVANALTPFKEQQSQWALQLARAMGDGHEQSPKPKEREKGLAFARCIRATAAAKMRGVGPDGAIEILKMWGDEDLAEEWKGARTKALAAGDATAGGFLVPPTFSQEVIEFLRAASVVRRLGARALPVPTGTINIPKLTGGATAYYVGENTNATKSEQTTGQLQLSFKKLVTLVPMSNSLLRYSSPGADAIVRDDTVNAMRVREDSAFIRDDGTASTPKGLRYWAHADHIVSMTASPSIQKTFTDLGTLVQKLLDANIPMIAPAWIMAPRSEMFLKTLVNSNGVPIFLPEMVGGRLWGFPYGTTTSVPTNLNTSGAGNNDESELYLVDMAQAIIGESMALLVDASQEAAYDEGGTVKAAYSLDQTVVRAIAEHDFGMRHDKAIAILNQLTWKPGSV